MDNQYLILIIGVLLICLGLAKLIIILYFIGDNYIVLVNTSLGVGDALGFFGNILTFIGTLVLGLIVLVQNRVFKNENDKAQVKLEKLAIQANDISKKLINIENNKMRPFIKISSKNIFFAVSKGLNGFSDKVIERFNSSRISFSRIVNNTKNTSLVKDVETIMLILDISNIGKAKIANIEIHELIFGDGVVGKTSLAPNVIYTNLLSSKHATLAINISNHIEIKGDANPETSNDISDYYINDTNHLEAIPIILELKYNDIYNREYMQRYSIHFYYLIINENRNEAVFKISQISIKYHIEDR